MGGYFVHEKLSVNAHDLLPVLIDVVTQDLPKCPLQEHPNVLNAIYSSLFEHEDQPNHVVKESGWEIALLLEPEFSIEEGFETDPCSQPSFFSGQKILDGIATFASAKEITLFVSERLSSMDWESGRLSKEKLRHQIGVLFAYGKMLSIALRRVQTTKLSAYWTSSFACLRKAMNNLSLLDRTAILDSPWKSLAFRCSSFFVEFVEEIVQSIRFGNELINLTNNDPNEKEMQFLVLTSFVLNVAEFLQSSDWNPLLVRRLKHAALAYGLSDYHLLSYESPEIDKKLHTDENDVERLSSVGHAIFVSFFCFDNEVSSPIKSDTFTPVLSNFWVCEQLFPLVFDLLESAQHTERLGWPATWMIRHCWNHLPSELLSHESSFSVHFTPDEFFQRCFLFLVSCPDHQLRSQLYTEAKKFLKAFTQETRAIVYRRLITESPYPSIAAAGLSALKEDIVQCWGKQRKAHVMRAGSHYQVAEVECQNFFEGPFLVSTILDELLDKNSKAYSVEETQKTVWNDDEVFFERHGVLMHVLNLYVFLIMRDKPESNKLGLWNENIVHSIRVKLLDPLKKRVPAIVTALSSEASHEDHDNEHDHKHAQTSGMRLLMMNMMETVLQQIDETIGRGLEVLSAVA